MAELDRLDREYGVGAMPSAPLAARTVPRKPRRQTGAVLPGLLITAIILTAVVALSPAENFRTIRRLAGFDNERLGEVPAVAQGEGSYSFTATQRGSKEPVAYDPCRIIEVAVNPDGAPDNYDELVDTAIERTSDATGLAFQRVGGTDDRDFTRRGSAIATRPPVLVAWATPAEVPDLEGDIAGIGGSAATASGNGKLRYVTGIVVLDRDTFGEFEDDEQPFAQAIVDHEFGHLVGLDHVEDPHELMNEGNVGVTTYGPGDREGLARLGSVDC